MVNKRIGTLTAGVFLVITGVLLLVHLVTGSSLPRIFIEVWPVILIALGAEIIFGLSTTRDAKLRYDVISMLVLFIVGTSAVGLYALQTSGILDVIKNATHYSTYNVELERKTIQVTAGLDRVILENGFQDIRVRVAKSDAVEIRGNVNLMAVSQNEARRMVANDKGYSIRRQDDSLIIETHRFQSKKWFLPGRIQESPLEITVPANLALEIDSSMGNVTMTANRVEKDWFIKNSGGSLDIVLPEKIDAHITVEANQLLGDLPAKEKGVTTKDESPGVLNVVENERSTAQLGHGGPHLRFIDPNGTASIYLR